MHPVRSPCGILDQNPEHDRDKQGGGQFDLPDRYRMACASYQREFVNDNQAREQNGINPPKRASRTSTGTNLPVTIFVLGARYRGS
jgi:hypothetical protein